VNTRLLLEWLNEYANDMRADREPRAGIGHIEAARMVIERREERKAKR
jgi:hypothetical protein